LDHLVDGVPVSREEAVVVADGVEALLDLVLCSLYIYISIYMHYISISISIYNILYIAVVVADGVEALLDLVRSHSLDIIYIYSVLNHECSHI
jgi:HD superfamily phosphohydrolase